jgi:hypothetical protein
MIVWKALGMGLELFKLLALKKTGRMLSVQEGRRSRDLGSELQLNIISVII